MVYLDIALAVIYDKSTDALFLGVRNSGEFSGYYEFVGGKIEQGEQACDALVRELAEETGVVVDVVRLVPFWVDKIIPKKGRAVQIHAFWLDASHNEFHQNIGLQGQKLTWQSAHYLPKLAMPEANQALVIEIGKKLRYNTGL